MAGSYGDNFGFRRSDERWTTGLYKTPVGSSLLIGTPVEINTSSAGFLKQCGANAAPLAGWCGLLIQELQFERSVYESDVSMVDTLAQGVAKANRLSVITGGAGIKFWVKNTVGSTRLDGRVIPTRTLYTITDIDVGDYITWDGSKYVVTAGQTNVTPFAKVEAVSATILEATLLA